MTQQSILNTQTNERTKLSEENDGNDTKGSKRRRKKMRAKVDAHVTQQQQQCLFSGCNVCYHSIRTRTQSLSACECVCILLLFGYVLACFGCIIVNNAFTFSLCLARACFIRSQHTSINRAYVHTSIYYVSNVEFCRSSSDGVSVVATSTAAAVAVPVSCASFTCAFFCSLLSLSVLVAMVVVVV